MIEEIERLLETPKPKPGRDRQYVEIPVDKRTWAKAGYTIAGLTHLPHAEQLPAWARGKGYVVHDDVENARWIIARVVDPNRLRDLTLVLDGKPVRCVVSADKTTMLVATENAPKLLARFMLDKRPFRVRETLTVRNDGTTTVYIEPDPQLN